MTLKEALDDLKIAFTNFEKAARSDDKTVLQNALALSESQEGFAFNDENPGIIVFADINRFKSINTAYGYAAGDAAISQVGILIEELFVQKCEARAFRASGDEFVILLQSRFLKKLKSAAKSFSSCSVHFEENKFSLGVSFGFAFGDEDFDFETIKRRAEIACKKAKSKGDGICLEWAEEMERTSLESLRNTCLKCGTINACEVPSNLKLNNLKACAICGTSFESKYRRSSHSKGDL